MARGTWPPLLLLLLLLLPPPAIWALVPRISLPLGEYGATPRGAGPGRGGGPKCLVQRLL